MNLSMPTANTAAAAGFFRLTEQVYADDPRYIPLGPAAEAAELDAPEYAGRQTLFLVERDGAARCRCVARLGADASFGTIGFFESLDDPPACRLLLEAAEEWLQKRGAGRVLGPMDGDTWRRYRFTIGPWEAAPFLKEPWNPPYYLSLWEACGYRAAENYLSARIANPAGAAERLMPFLRRVRRQGYGFRPVRKAKLETELDILYRLSPRIFEGNRHYTPIGRDAFLRLYDGVRPLLVAELCQFCCAPDGREIGFLFAYPDYADAVRAMRGRRDLWGRLAFLWRRRRASRVCLKSLGCLPEYRGTGVGPALVALVLEQTAARGYREALMCLMHEDNVSTRLDGGSSEPFRRYVLYEKDL